MLFLLRNIRRKLLSNNKVSTYFFYAIGEVILVVVGILIAMQIGNWNEDRKHLQAEKKYFQNLKNDLLADKEKLTQMVAYAQEKVAAAKRVTTNIKLGMSGSLYDFSQDMQTLIFVDEFRPEQSAYDEMKSSGNFSSIQNDLLKLKLIELQQVYIEIEALQEHMRYDFNVFLEDFEKYINWSNYYDMGKSDVMRLSFVFDSTYIESHAAVMHSEIKNLFANKVFPNNVFLIEINHTYEVEMLNNTKAQISEIIDILDREIETK